MFDVVGRLLSSCISHLTRRRTTETKEDASCDREYNTGDARHDEQPLPLFVEMKTEMNGLKGDTKGVDKPMNDVEKMIKKMMAMKRRINEMKNFSDNDESEPRTAIEIRTVPVNGGRVDGDDEDETSSATSAIAQLPTWTAIEPGKPRRRGSLIYWKEGDEIIRKMQADRMSKDEEIPSFWNYDPRCLPKEFVGLDQKSFLVDPSAFNICFFDKDILCKICKMLSPMDFLNLSYTCRFLHWRLFTFCTCYAPYTVWAAISDLKISDDNKEIVSKMVYTLRLEENRNLTDVEGLRAVFAPIPSCLRRPFFFDSLEVGLYLPLFTKDDVDRCLPFILAVRKYVGHLQLMLYYYMCPINDDDKFYDYQAVNDFLQTVNASSYFCYEHSITQNNKINRKFKIFENCPYARLIDTMSCIRFDDQSKWKNLVLLNRIGHYLNPPVSAIIRTIEEFKYGTANLDYHEYKFETRGQMTAFLKYLFANYGEVEEYSRLGHPRHEYESARQIVRFATITTEETGRRHRIKVWTDCNYKYNVAVGKKSTFAENLKQRRRSSEDFEDLEDCKASSIWYRMETALEPEGDEDMEETAVCDNSF